MPRNHPSLKNGDAMLVPSNISHKHSTLSIQTDTNTFISYNKSWVKQVSENNGNTNSNRFISGF